MIAGTLRGREAVVPLTLRDRHGAAETVDAVIDTGSERSLTLPPDLFERFGRGYLRETAFIVADRREVRSWASAVEVLWDGRPRRVTAILLAGEPLLGTPMAANHRLTIDATEGGRVRIEPLDA